MLISILQGSLCLGNSTIGNVGDLWITGSGTQAKCTKWILICLPLSPIPILAIYSSLTEGGVNEVCMQFYKENNY